MDLIDYRDSRPIYEQITERYKTLILKGVLEPGEQMPSVRQLAMELSTTTVMLDLPAACATS